MNLVDVKVKALGSPDTGWALHVATDLIGAEDRPGGQKILSHVLASRCVPSTVTLLKFLIV